MEPIPVSEIDNYLITFARIDPRYVIKCECGICNKNILAF